MEVGGPTPEALEHGIHDHVVIVGYGRVGTHIGAVLRHLGLAYLVVEQDSQTASNLQNEGILTLFGDAANSEVLTHAGLEHALALVLTVPNEASAELLVTAAHRIAPNLPIIARASTPEGVKRLTEHGAYHVIHPELEGGLEIVRHTLMTLGYPMGQIQSYVDAVREDAYEGVNSEGKHRVLDQLVSAVRGMEIVWLTIAPDSSIVGQTLAEANLRAKLGISVIALVRDHQVMPNPKSDTQFHAGDLVGFIGSTDEIAEAQLVLHPGD